MSKWILPAGAVAVAVLGFAFLPVLNRPAAAQTEHHFVSAVEYDVLPGKLNDYLAALKENGAASVKDPGCEEFLIGVSQTDPNHVFILEVYDNEEVRKAHNETAHFKKYKAATAGMTTNRKETRLWSVDTYLKGK